MTSQRGEALIQGDERAYYADKAYDSRARCAASAPNWGSRTASLTVGGARIRA
jgi:hypothetical protein